MDDKINDQLVLISGESSSGKSASLMNLKNQDRWLYLNCEAGKRLPFRNKFQAHTITDPYQIFEAFEAVAVDGPMHGQIDGIIIDSITFLMDMFESQYVKTSSNTQQAWGEYAEFFKRLLQYYIAGSDKAVLILGHTLVEYDEKNMRNNVRLNIKGSVGKGNGAEAYFSTVVSTKKVELKHLENQDRKLLNITPQDEALGYKHVFQTQLTKETVGERIRSPMGMFELGTQTFMDNDAQMLLEHLNSYYNEELAA